MKPASLLLLGVCFGAFCGAEERQSPKAPLTFEALNGIPAPGGLRLSPDGAWLAYSVRQSSLEKNGGSSALWIMKTQDGSSKLLQEGAYNYAWIEGGARLAYLTSANGPTRCHLYDPRSEKTELFNNLPAGLNNFVWSPTNKGLLYTQAVSVQDPKPGVAKRHSARTYENLLFRAYSRWDDGLYSHVFYYDFATKKSVDLTPGPFHAPTSHLGGEQDVVFSPDGQMMAYTSNPDPVRAISTNNEIYLLELPGKEKLPISYGKGSDTSPSFSPSGSYVAYLTMETPGYESDKKDLILADTMGYNLAKLTSDFPCSVNSFSWSKNSGKIFFTCKENGADSLYVIDLAKDKITNLLKEKVFNSVQICPDEKSLYCITSRTDVPPEIARYDFESGAFKTLTGFGEQFLKRHALSKTEVIKYPGAKGDQIMAFMTYPPDFDPKKKYPMLLVFHGGPEFDWDGGWTNYCGNPNHLASWGYVVVRPNIHGATSYGQTFKEAILGNWGRVDQEDVLRGLDYIAAHCPFVDMANVGAIGRSYGGYLVNWLNGQTDRFKCFVSIDGIFDQIMSYFSTDELWFMEKEFRGTPMTNREEYLRSSPSTYAKNFKTPALILHGGIDYRVDSSQGIAMFTALQRLGIPSKLIYFPDESHYFSKPQNWNYAYEEQEKWLARFLKPQPAKEKLPTGK